MMAKLSDTQLIILSKALAHEDGAATLAPNLNKAGAMRAGASLVQKKLVREIKAKPGMPMWREDEDGRPLSLVITSAGRKAIGDEDTAPRLVSAAASGGVVPEAAAAITKEKAGKAKKAGLIPAAEDQINRPLPQTGLPRENSKQALIIKVMSAEAGPRSMLSSRQRAGCRIRQGLPLRVFASAGLLSRGEPSGRGLDLPRNEDKHSRRGLRPMRPKRKQPASAPAAFNEAGGGGRTCGRSEC